MTLATGISCKFYQTRSLNVREILMNTCASIEKEARKKLTLFLFIFIEVVSFNILS